MAECDSHLNIQVLISHTDDDAPDCDRDCSTISRKCISMGDKDLPLQAIDFSHATFHDSSLPVALALALLPLSALWLVPF